MTSTKFIKILLQDICHLWSHDVIRWVTLCQALQEYVQQSLVRQATLPQRFQQTIRFNRILNSIQKIVLKIQKTPSKLPWWKDKPTNHEKPLPDDASDTSPASPARYARVAVHLNRPRCLAALGTMQVDWSHWVGLGWELVDFSNLFGLEFPL